MKGLSYWYFKVFIGNHIFEFFNWLTEKEVKDLEWELQDKNIKFESEKH